MKRKGFEGKETVSERVLSNRNVTPEQQATKMANLKKLGQDGFRVYRAISHDTYFVKGKTEFYNPYTDTWHLD